MVLSVLVIAASRAVIAQNQQMPAADVRAGYVRPEACAGCHRDVWETYRRTGMARSFSRISSAVPLENFKGGAPFYHKPSDSYFVMVWRGANLYQRRYQLDHMGREMNVMEKRVDYVMGSGNHARTYLHRTARGTLVELPLGWYAEKGGYWGMNPGYDRRDHDGFRRTVGYDCMFCHNGYPNIPAGHDQPFSEPVYTEPLPEGVDCQRCHGPGAAHVRVAGTPGAIAKVIRSSIVNPSRLTSDRQMEVCMACHLETTSFPLPNAIERYERGPFSYKPGEPLGNFILTFDHAPGSGRENKFEIAGAAYRLRQSRCYLRSGRKLLCTTCHNPHDIPRGQQAEEYYTAVCRACHASEFAQLVASGKHSQSNDCIGCHMPKRRTEDAVHVVMTDHLIQRRKPPGDLLADIPERHETAQNAYRGPVVLYYPEKVPATPGNELDLAVAQVSQGSNLHDGIRQLAAAIERYRPMRGEYYFELAEAWRNSGNFQNAIPLYREAIERDPKLSIARQRLGFTLRRSGQYSKSVQVLKEGISGNPDNASAWLELGLTYREMQNDLGALAAFTKASELDPDMPEARNNLGILRYAAGDMERAAAAFREAIRIQPNFPDAHANLAALLSRTGALDEALEQFTIALKLRPDDAGARYNYAVALGRARRFGDAQRELEAALRGDPALARAHELLADLLMAKGQTRDALPHYRDAVRLEPESMRAQFGLGAALASLGDKVAAIPYLEKASQAKDAGIRAQAIQLLHRVRQ